MNEETVFWTPLIGFDRDLPDHGAAEYLRSVSIRPSIISLFVFNPDIITLHQAGMPNKFEFPQDYCNYYGSVQNEIRSVQPWTNYDLRELIDALHQNHIQCYLGIMGMHTHVNGDEPGCFGYVARQQLLTDYPELEMNGALWSGNNYILKRFSDGRYFEDFLIQKIKEALLDYGADGIHFADGMFPPCIQLSKGDFSDDMLDQFCNDTGHTVPDPIRLPLYHTESPGIAARADYVWTHLRLEWITYIRSRWTEFFRKLCNTLHAHGKKVLVNNAWTSEPFEALYRFGIDYRAISLAGVDGFCLEDQATTIRATGEDSFPYKIHEYMLLPAFLRAYAPDSCHYAINFAKDSTEEASFISHLPCADQREIMSLSSHLYYGEKGITRCIDGFCICLADAIKPQEWEWLERQYRYAFESLPIASLSPILAWSDNLIDQFLPIYLKTRRWSAHKLTAELSKRGGKIGGVLRLDSPEALSACSAALFVPNADLLSESEKKVLSRHRAEILTISTLPDPLGIGERWHLKDTADSSSCQLYLSCYGDKLSPEEISSVQEQTPASFVGEEDDAPDAFLWFYDLTFRKVSEGFLRAAAKALHLLTHSPADSSPDFPFTAYQMPDGAIRCFSENDRFAQYHAEIIRVTKKIKRLHNIGDFPAQPLKLCLPNGQVVADTTPERKLIQTAVGFRINMPPAGISVVDVYLDSGVSTKTSR